MDINIVEKGFSVVKELLIAVALLAFAGLLVNSAWFLYSSSTGALKNMTLQLQRNQQEQQVVMSLIGELRELKNDKVDGVLSKYLPPPAPSKKEMK